MAKKHYNSSMRAGTNGSQEHFYQSGKNGRSGMIPNNGVAASPISEDWNAPALVPRGVHEMRVDGNMPRRKVGKLGDLFEQVEKTTRMDQAAFDSITDPTNW